METLAISTFTEKLHLPTGDISVICLSSQGASQWDAFVHHSEQSLPTHLSVWREILAKTYGYQCFFLMAYQGEQVRGVLPLFQVNSLLLGRSLQSLPGAICAESQMVAQELIDAADQLARDIRADHLILRDSRQDWGGNRLEVIEAHRGIRSILPSDTETAWKGLSKDLRYHIRHGWKQAAVKVVVDNVHPEDFFKVFETFCYHMGTPGFGLKFIHNVLNGLSEDCLISNAYYQDIPISGYFNFKYGNKIFGMWGGTIHEYQPYKATHQVLWAMIEYAVQNGFTQIDMGRSAYPSRQYEFKAQWGNETYPIYQLFRIYKGKPPLSLELSKSRDGRKTSQIQSLWRKMPIGVARMLGPRVRRHMPFA